MNLLRRPIVAFVITTFFVLVTSVAMFALAPEERAELLEPGEVEEVDKEEVVEIPVTGEQVYQFHGISFSTESELFHLLSPEEEFLWLYASQGDVSSMIQLSVVDLSTDEITETDLSDFFFGLFSSIEAIPEAISPWSSIFSNRGYEFTHEIGDVERVGITYAFIVPPSTLFSVIYSHVDGGHSDIRSDFEHILNNFWVGEEEVIAGLPGSEPNVTQEEMSDFVRETLAEMEQDLDDNQYLIPAFLTASEPINFDTFMEAPGVIYTTPASENGLGDMWMFAEGTVDSWEFTSGFHMMKLDNEMGRLFFAIPEPLVDTTVSDIQEKITPGMEIRVYFQYQGFSEVLELGGGMMVGYRVLD